MAAAKDAKEAKEARSARLANALLRVPSVPAAMIEHNVLINPGHPDFARLTPRAPFPVH